MKKILLVLLLVFMFPVLAFAQDTDFTNATSTLQTVRNLINQLIPIGIGIGVLVFIFGLIKYVSSGADEGDRASARNTIIWGIIVIFAMTAVWGLVKFVRSTTGIGTGNGRYNQRNELPKAPKYVKPPRPTP